MRQLKISKQVTNRDTMSLEKYLHEIGKIELLTPESEVELSKRIKTGDREAFEKLINAILRFVVSMKPGVLNLYPMQFGGSGSRSCRRWPKMPGSSAFP